MLCKYPVAFTQYSFLNLAFQFHKSVRSDAEVMFAYLFQPYKVLIRPVARSLAMHFSNIFVPLFPLDKHCVPARLFESVTEVKGCLVTECLNCNTVHIFSGKIYIALIMKKHLRFISKL